jgi:hypothetical protein
VSTVPRTKSPSLLRYVFAGCGWLVVFYEWVHVSHQAPGRDELTLVLVLIPSLFLIHAGASAWIAHSKRLAVRGKRGLVTRYTSPVFTQDHLGRRLLMDERSIGSKEIVISIHGDAKFYTPAAETSLPSNELDTSLDREVKACTPVKEVWG